MDSSRRVFSFFKNSGFRSKLLIAYFIEIASILISVNSVAAESLSIAAVMRGPQAPGLLASALVALAKNHPKFIFEPIRKTSDITSIANVCGRQQDNIDLRPCTFWDAATFSKVWPSDAPLLDEVVKALGANGDYLLPNVKVTIETSAISSTISLAGSELNEDEQRTLCRRQRWSNSEDDLNCVIEVIPAFGLKASQSKTRRVIIRQRVIRLVVPNVSNSNAEPIRNTLRKAFAEYRTTAGSRAAVEENIEVRPLSQSILTTPCFDSQLRQAAVVARTLINWPSVIHPKKAKKGTIAVVEYDTKLFPPSRIQIFNEDIRPPSWPDGAVSAANHPVFKTPEALAWELDCASVMQSLPEGQLAHTMAVASILLGNSIKLNLSPAGSIEIFPFFEPGSLQIDSLNAILPAGNLAASDGEQQVIIAALQTTPPAPPALLEKQQKPHAYKVKDYQSVTHLLNATGRILIASAPIVVSEIPLDEDADPTDNFPCLSWPACLDSLGLTITVAALDNQSQLMLKEPGTGHPYEITQRTVSVAAPGEFLPVAATAETGPTLALASGTSLAAPVVAAVALQMRDNFDKPSESYDIISAIEATADLTRNFNRKIRFGVVNAARAFSVASLPLRAALTFKKTNDERADANEVTSQIQEVQGVPPPDNCRVSEIQKKRGVLLFYRNNDPLISASGYAEPPQCIAVNQLLRIRETANDNGRRQYAIVFNDIKSYVEGPFPQIFRNVYLEPQSATASQCMTAFGIPGGVGATQPCLTGIDESGQRVAISLINSDIAFQPSGWREFK